MGNAAVASEIDELDALLSDVGAEVEAVSSQTVIEVSPEAVSIDELDAIEEIAEDLEEAETKPVVTLSVPKESQNKGKATAKKASKSSTSVPKLTASTNLVEYGQKLFNKEQPLMLTVDDGDLDALEATETNLKALQEVKAVKAREKLANVLVWAAMGKTLSKYTRATLELAKSKEKFTKADVSNNLLDNGVSLSTASSQAGQMTHVLVALKIATLKGNEFVTNKDSTLLQLLGSEASSTGE